MQRSTTAAKDLRDLASELKIIAADLEIASHSDKLFFQHCAALKAIAVRLSTIVALRVEAEDMTPKDLGPQQELASCDKGRFTDGMY